MLAQLVNVSTICSKKLYLPPPSYGGRNPPFRFASLAIAQYPVRKYPHAGCSETEWGFDGREGHWGHQVLRIMTGCVCLRMS